ncbi:Di-copper centre-containing protein [Setomelanomma holmii]|uniref:Di-copper centre-containing protein n=1 Tax=Setomelanomma holmii TaxID=210430 RepID=A0A9P4LIH7_9PLEO|nr:Di-copper centre-containing protein [Setomelanomma holmii]
MKLQVLLSLSIIGGTSAAKFLEVDSLAAQGMVNLGLHVAQNGYPSPKTCTLNNVAIRREWSTLSKSAKLNYINAVNCLAKLPAKTPALVAPGAKSRYDDLVVTHIQQSNNIHGTGSFLSWHRYFTWTYEQMLRNECGYKDDFPYYNWAWWAEDPKSSPLFDGSETSMSGDGAYIAGRNYSCFPYETPCYMKLQPGSGGGCVTSGPFKDWQVNMGPLQSMLKIPGGLPPNPQTDGLGYNPRCLRRDISLQSSNETRDEMVSALIKNYPEIARFQRVYQGEFTDGKMGVHTGGHYTIGGDAGSDFYNSPADPAFFPHHGMIDRVWWTWQNLELKNRQNALAGGTIIGGLGPNATLNDTLTMGSYVGVPNITIADAMSTLAGPFCYIYV